MTDLERQKSLKRKQDYFGGFDLLAADSDDEADDGRRASMLCLKRARDLVTSKAKLGGPNSLSRSVSETHVYKLNQTSTKNLQPLPSAAGVKPPTSLLKSSTYAGEVSAALVGDVIFSPAIPQTSGRRKGNVKFNLVPEGQQIFRGLRFYFFPPGDKHPARRMRITKAMSFGAAWCKEWDRSITHVIVDKNIEYCLLLKYLRMDALPTEVVMVSENYPSECICYRTMLDAKQRQFMVKGFPPSASLEKASIILPSSNDSDRSLKVKPAGKAIIARHAGTRTTDNS
nr:hypothetical protein CFP56_62696 [Quercus suber]